MTLPSVKTLVKSMLVFGGVQALSVGTGIVRVAAAAKLIGTTGVGLSTIFNTFSGFTAELMGFGLCGSGVHYLSDAKVVGEERTRDEILQADEAVQRVRLLMTLSAFAAMLLTIVASPFLSLLYFDDWSHTSHFLLLSVAVAALLLSDVERSVLRSLQQTNRLAVALSVTALLTLVCTIPFYVLMGVGGVIYAVVACAVSSCVVTLWLGALSHPWRLSVWRRLTMSWRDFLATSRPLFTLGVAFVISGVALQGIELFTQTWMARCESFDYVGLYKQGYQLAVTYPAMLFTAISNDFYPRLAAVNRDVRHRTALVNRQILVSFSIALPCLVAFWFLIPYVVPLVLSDDFMPIVPMARWALAGVAIKAIYLPIAYLPLAQGRSVDYMIVEVISLVLSALFIYLGYLWADLEGIGQGILCSEVLYLVTMVVFTRVRYDYRFLTSHS